MSGTLIWRARGGFIEGVTFRRPKISVAMLPKKDMLHLENGGRLHMVESILDNEGADGCTAIVCGSGTYAKWKKVALTGGNIGLSVDHGASLTFEQVRYSLSGKDLLHYELS